MELLNGCCRYAVFLLSPPRPSPAGEGEERRAILHWRYAGEPHPGPPPQGEGVNQRGDGRRLLYLTGGGAPRRTLWFFLHTPERSGCM